MTSILQNKLAKKAVLLFALIAALVVLRTPVQALTKTQCLDRCSANEGDCIRDCRGSATCERGCAVELQYCEKGC